MRFERAPCVYILSGGYNGPRHVGVTSDLPKRNLIERQNSAWNDLAVAIGLNPLPLPPAAR